MDRARLVGVALALVSAAAFGVMPVLATWVYDDGGDPLGVLAVRFPVAAAVLLAIAVLRGEALPRGRPLVALALMGAVGYVVQSACYFLALERVGAGLTALLLYFHPALVVLLAAALARRRPTPVALGCVVVATVGTWLTLGPVQGGQLTGVLLGLGAAVAYSLYIVAGSAVGPACGPFATAGTVMAAAGLVYATVGAARGVGLPGSAGGWTALLGVALVGTVVATAAFFAALARLGPGDTAVVSTAEPVVSVVAAALLLGERFSPLQAAGGALVVAAVVVLARSAPVAQAQAQVVPA